MNKSRSLHKELDLMFQILSDDEYERKLNHRYMRLQS